MQETTFYILPDVPGIRHQQSQLSFGRFIDFIQEKAINVKVLKTLLYRYILNYFHKHPEIAKSISIEAIGQYPEWLDLLDASLLPILNNEQELLWALSVPNTDAIFYSTSAFYSLMSPDNPNGMAATASDIEMAAFYDSLRQVNYALILERFYDIKALVQQEIIYVWTDKLTGLPKYYNIQIDNRFVNVCRITKQPKAASGFVHQQLKQVQNLCQMEGTVCLNEFSFSGFSIITATDITARHALHKMRSAIIRHVPENFEETYKTVLFLLQALCGRQHVQFGLLPFLKINDQLVSFYTNYFHSIAINIARQQEISEPVFVTWLNHYFQNPKVIFHGAYETEMQNGHLQQAFEKEGIKAYVQIPIYHNNELAGMLEVSALSENVLNEKLLSVLDAATPILAQLMHNHQAEFRSSIDRVIKMNFTAIQPSVQWKFNEVAWKYLKNKYEQDRATDIESIRFQQVYPLYGAIDIRNSTNERNNALYKDSQHFFSLLKETLVVVYPYADNIQVVNSLLRDAETLQNQMNVYMSGYEEVIVIQLMDRVKMFLQTFKNHPVYQSVIENYFSAVHPDTGIVYAQRRALEQSMQLINGSINQYLELMQSEIQQSYPVFFEKFRTDGVEYDIYIGPSINPQLVYQQAYLKKLRQLQLTSMAAIAKMVHSSELLRTIHLQTTQLIFVNAGTIDISFRKDEKRFDVEGGYNIRYHIVKKRIDKVHVKETGERLTQPDKIAIVYSQEGHRESYLDFIAQLQRDGILQSQTEELNLEDLQGVTGLKALRVSVVL